MRIIDVIGENIWGACGKTCQYKSTIMSEVDSAIRRRALSFNKIGPFRLTSATDILVNLSCACHNYILDAAYSYHNYF